MIKNRISNRNWDVVAGYVAIGLAGMLFIGYTWYRKPLAPLTLWFVLLGFVAIIPFAGIFLDSIYLRDHREGWMPQRWFHIGIPVLIMIGSYLVLLPSSGPFTALPLALGSFGIATWIASLLYLCRRHQYIGVP